MPIFTEPEEPEFARIEARDAWIPTILLAEYGELEGVPPDIEVPESLNFLLQVPIERRYDFEEAECGLAYVADDGIYACSIWDVTGEDDDPWAVFVVDEFGARLLAEYSMFEEETSEEARDAVLLRASTEIPARAARGEFTRTGMPVEIPAWLRVAPELGESGAE